MVQERLSPLRDITPSTPDGYGGNSIEATAVSEGTGEGLPSARPQLYEIVWRVALSAAPAHVHSRALDRCVNRAFREVWPLVRAGRLRDFDELARLVERIVGKRRKRYSGEAVAM